MRLRLVRASAAWLALALAGCAGDDGSPAWAFDPLWLEPTEDGGVYGFQTWEIFSPRWTKRFDERYYLCSVVVELHGTPTQTDADCPACEHAWDVEPSLLEDDCGEAIAGDPGFLSLARVAIGEIGADLADGDPHPSRSVGGYADYGDGEWVPHGWAYPEALDTRGNVVDSDWNDEQAFTFWPAWFWDLST